ncbi:unnamed protein product, partial [Mesorhabditis belari]|uniref:Uncharacterized protein n=1 Tax=Mesorhabditis belari TaxID=2138241 RepID=A0AAF3F8Y7_9BILA
MSIFTIFPYPKEDEEKLTRKECPHCLKKLDEKPVERVPENPTLNERIWGRWRVNHLSSGASRVTNHLSALFANHTNAQPILSQEIVVDCGIRSAMFCAWRAVGALSEERQFEEILKNQ